jgi:hypothetical protein
VETTLLYREKPLAKDNKKTQRNSVKAPRNRSRAQEIRRLAGNLQDPDRAAALLVWAKKQKTGIRDLTQEKPGAGVKTIGAIDRNKITHGYSELLNALLLSRGDREIERALELFPDSRNLDLSLVLPPKGWTGDLRGVQENKERWRTSGPPGTNRTGDPPGGFHHTWDDVEEELDDLKDRATKERDEYRKLEGDLIQVPSPGYAKEDGREETMAKNTKIKTSDPMSEDLIAALLNDLYLSSPSLGVFDDPRNAPEEVSKRNPYRRRPDSDYSPEDEAWETLAGMNPPHLGQEWQAYQDVGRSADYNEQRIERMLNDPEGPLAQREAVHEEKLAGAREEDLHRRLVGGELPPEDYATRLTDMVTQKREDELFKELGDEKYRYGDDWDVSMYRNPTDISGRSDQVVKRKRGEEAPESAGLQLTKKHSKSVDEFVSRHKEYFTFDAPATLAVAQGIEDGLNDQDILNKQSSSGTHIIRERPTDPNQAPGAPGVGADQPGTRPDVAARREARWDEFGLPDELRRGATESGKDYLTRLQQVAVDEPFHYRSLNQQTGSDYDRRLTSWERRHGSNSRKVSRLNSDLGRLDDELASTQKIYEDLRVNNPKLYEQNASRYNDRMARMQNERRKINLEIQARSDAGDFDSAYGRNWAREAHRVGMHAARK